MTLNQLGYFYQAAVLQHFNQAAEKINISEPSLSRSITALENELGVTLFEKRGRNVTLTKAGEIFLEHVTQILDDVTRASNKMQQIATILLMFPRLHVNLFRILSAHFFP